MSDIVVAALYRFARFPEFQSFRKPYLDLMKRHQVRGTLLLAPEGINGTIAGSRQGVDQVLAGIRQDPRFADMEVKESAAETRPFFRAKVKLKQEIVTMGQEHIDPGLGAGTYVEPRDWNKLFSAGDVLLVDTRNDYENRIGSFRGAVNPGTASFREFPGFVSRQLDPQKHRKIAMFCTGGIRCEKSTALLRQQGFAEVYHLRGGILKYLEEVPESDSLWEGECFVFDNRVTVNHRLEPGAYLQCHACRMPVSPQDRESEYYQQGISCPRCHDRHSRQQVKRFAERERQKALARERGESHIGQPMGELISRKRREKLGLKSRQRQSSSGKIG